MMGYETITPNEEMSFVLRQVLSKSITILPSCFTLLSDGKKINH
jgi:hypothetical protein